jgi:hypothetical protein
MSVSIGSKPIVTSGLTHLYDQLSPKCMPSGSETWNNHLPDSYVAKNANKSKSMTKNGLVTYGNKTTHAHLKGYDDYDGSSDYWTFADATHTDLPLIAQPFTMIIWCLHPGGNTSTRSVGGWGGSNSSGFYYSSYGEVYWANSKMKPYWHHFGTGTSDRYCLVDTNVGDNLWHMWCFRQVSNSSRNLTIDAGDHGSASNTSSASMPFNTNTYNFHIGIARRYTSGWNSGWLGKIGPWYLWNRELSDDEVRQMYNANKDRFS